MTLPINDEILFFSFILFQLKFIKNNALIGLQKENAKRNCLISNDEGK